MKRLNLFCLSLFVLHLAGCGDGPTGPGSDRLWPMAVGNRWIGMIEYFNSRGESLSTAYDTTSIVRSVSIGGETWYEFDDGVRRTNRSDGVWVSFGGSNSNDFIRLIAKYPTVPGDTFQTERGREHTIHGPTGDSILMWIGTLSVDSIVAVPRGTFTCHAYAYFTLHPHMSEAGRGIQSWAYAPGVGPVFYREAHLSGGLSDSTYWTWSLVKAEFR